MSHAAYYAELTFQLRHRGLDDASLVEALRGVQELSRDSGRSPEEEFGTPAEYAERFPDRVGVTAKITGSVGTRLFKTALYLLLGLYVVNLFLNFGEPDRGLNGLLVLACSGVTMFVIAMIGGTIDRRLPKGFTLEPETR